MPLVLCLAAALPGAAIARAAAASATGAAVKGAPEPLDYAFRFASAIVADDADRTRAQAEVAADLAAGGSIDEAERRASRIDGWRRGEALGAAALAAARAGDGRRARDLAAKAAEVRAAATDWGGPRIDALLAETLVTLGDAERAPVLLASLAVADPRQYGGQVAALDAAQRLRTDGFDAAMERLGAIAADQDLDVAWGRTLGYVRLARAGGLEPARARRALEAARTSADGVPGWKRAEALLEIAAAWREVEGDARAGSLEALRAADAIIAPQPATMPVKARLMGDLAVAWAGAGDRRRGRALLKQAEAEAPRAAIIDRPEAYARIAAAWEALGDRSASSRLFAQALDGAAGLVNARPRALAAVAICRALSRGTEPLAPGTRARLDGLLGGLGDPW